MTSAGAGRKLIRTLHWQRLDTPGSEYFALSQVPDGWELSGTVIVTLDDEPVVVRYTVQCASNWDTREVDVVTESGGRSGRLHLRADGGRWASDEGAVSLVDTAIDVDLGVTPSTNTLPIRRVELDVGQHEDLVVAWIRFPDLSVSRSDQRYTRLAETVYRYESGTFRRDIEVDELGLVTEYPGLFVRESVLSG